MALLGIPLLLVGGMALYSGYKEHKYLYGGDTLKTVGPAPYEGKVTEDGQVRGGVVAPQILFSDDAIINPMDNGVMGKGRHAGHIRQTVNRRVDPFSNGQLRSNFSQRSKTLGADVYPQGLRQYVPPYEERTFTEASMKTPHFDQFARFNIGDHGQHSVAMGNALPPADAGKPLLYAKPVASYVTQQRHMPQAFMGSSMMTRPTKKTMHLHDRSNAPDLGMWTAKETREATDHPSTSEFWAGKPQSEILQHQFVRRNTPTPNLMRINPNFGGEMGRQRQLWVTKRVEAP